MLSPSASQVQSAAVTAPSAGGRETGGDAWEGGILLPSLVDPEVASEVDSTAELFAASGLAMVEGGLEPTDYSDNGPEGMFSYLEWQD